MPKYAFLTGAPNFGDVLISFLNHGADKTGEFRYVALDELSSEVDIAKHPIKGVFLFVIGRIGKKFSGSCRPVVCRDLGQVIFAFEVMKECALRHASLSAKVIHCCSVISVLADQLDCRLQ